MYFIFILTPLLWEMKKNIKTLIFFSFPIKTFFKWIINQCPKGIHQHFPKIIFNVVIRQDKVILVVVCINELGELIFSHSSLLHPSGSLMGNLWLLTQLWLLNKNLSIEQSSSRCHTCRGVHGSVWVGFVPNPRPTRQNRVEKILIHRRPGRESDRLGRFCAGNTVCSVGIVHGEKSSQNS